MEFEKVNQCENLEFGYICDFSGGYVSRNKKLFENIELTSLNKFILEKSVFGTPIFKLGGGKTKLLVLSGIHGNELSPQIANLRLMNELADKKLSSTLYFIPFAAPKSSMNSERNFNSMDLNRSAHISNSLSNLILRTILDLGIDFVGDFHSTGRNSNPGFESIFSSKSPTPESFLMASHISRDVGSEVIAFDFAGSSYKGAVEDVCNLKGIPAVTCEVLCPFSNVNDNAIETSFKQMKSFLDYFGV
ncbi:succinylglutamate desuccinylase/aspartoacylase family protein [uncultured Methanobrevibacter sp.]|uniref:succinylglutamate desuccinylase/aspartoacylase domain-containing protein n=1 Tax=uncultured Methanobrevibacter sp. TaxID=253161 RepID=UPI002604967B|nr:succinylglutamate desuccinylase/aspartoacylase family protein [uncultured Methanobrevibacter sp.]